MKKIKKGDIVSRNSYQNDILFYVEKIVKTENRGKGKDQAKSGKCICHRGGHRAGDIDPLSGRGEVNR